MRGEGGGRHTERKRERETGTERERDLYQTIPVVGDEDEGEGREEKRGGESSVRS